MAKSKNKQTVHRNGPKKKSNNDRDKPSATVWINIRGTRNAGDLDGKIEIVGMESTTYLYDTVRIYERSDTGIYEEVFAADDVDYFPWDIGDTDRDGLPEILGNKKDLTYLYESPAKGSYPSERIWQMEDIWGGRIADMDMDGQKEIVSRHLDTDEIYIYENRGERSYLRAARLRNPTEGENFLSTTFAISDFDGDGSTEVVVGDWDGDLFIYENVSDDKYLHIWTGSVPNSHIRYIASGDFDGDGQDEFLVEAQVAVSSDAAKRQWVYTVFDHSDLSEYKAVWSHVIMGIRSSVSGVSSGDVDNDGRDEIVVLVTPNLYVFRFADFSTPGDWQMDSLWHHSASETRWLIIEDMDEDGANEILFNAEDKLTTFQWSQSAITPIRRPWGLTATPLGEDEVQLYWNGPHEAIFCRSPCNPSKNLRPVHQI